MSQRMAAPGSGSGEPRAVKRGRSDDVVKDKRRKTTFRPVDMIVDALNKNIRIKDEDVLVAMATVETIGEVSAIYTRLSDEHPSDPAHVPSNLYRKVRLLQLLKIKIKLNPTPIVEFITLMCRMQDGITRDPTIGEFRKELQGVCRYIYLLRRHPHKCEEKNVVSSAHILIQGLILKFLA